MKKDLVLKRSLIATIVFLISYGSQSFAQASLIGSWECLADWQGSEASWEMTFDNPNTYKSFLKLTLEQGESKVIAEFDFDGSWENGDEGNSDVHIFSSELNSIEFVGADLPDEMKQSLQSQFSDPDSWTSGNYAVVSQSGDSMQFRANGDHLTCNRSE